MQPDQAIVTAACDTAVVTATWATVIALFLGPIIAIVITRWVDIRREDYKSKSDLFSTLMRSRIQPVSAEHVVAINLIPVVYKKHQKIIDSFNTFVEHLNTKRSENYVEWDKKKEKLLFEILYQMSCILDINIRESDLNKPYWPQAWADSQSHLLAMQEYQFKIATGKEVMKVEIVNSSFPQIEE